MKLFPIIAIGLGGFIGSVLRYLMAVFFSKQYPGSFMPYGTFAVNFLGCLLIGIIYGLSERFEFLSPNWRLFLATGICGGFTTFSTFAYENISLLQQTNYAGFAFYSIITFAICLGAVFAGLSIIKIF